VERIPTCKVTAYSWHILAPTVGIPFRRFTICNGADCRRGLHDLCGTQGLLSLSLHIWPGCHASVSTTPGNRERNRQTSAWHHELPAHCGISLRRFPVRVMKINEPVSEGARPDQGEIVSVLMERSN
jgi:hypothetical protein